MLQEQPKNIQNLKQMKDIGQVLLKLTSAFAGRQMTVTTIEDEGEPKKIEGLTIVGIWLTHDLSFVEFAYHAAGSPFLRNVSVPVGIKAGDDWCHLPHEFGKTFGNAVHIPEVGGVPSFREAFLECFE